MPLDFCLKTSLDSMPPRKQNALMNTKQLTPFQVLEQTGKSMMVGSRQQQYLCHCHVMGLNIDQKRMPPFLMFLAFCTRNPWKLSRPHFKNQLQNSFISPPLKNTGSWCQIPLLSTSTWSFTTRMPLSSNTRKSTLSLTQNVILRWLLQQLWYGWT